MLIVTKSPICRSLHCRFVFHATNRQSAACEADDSLQTLELTQHDCQQNNHINLCQEATKEAEATCSAASLPWMSEYPSPPSPALFFIFYFSCLRWVTLKACNSLSLMQQPLKYRKWWKVSQHLSCSIYLFLFSRSGSFWCERLFKKLCSENMLKSSVCGFHSDLCGGSASLWGSGPSWTWGAKVLCNVARATRINISPLLIFKLTNQMLEQFAQAVCGKTGPCYNLWTCWTTFIISNLT